HSYSRRSIELRLQALTIGSTICPFLTCEEICRSCKSVFPQNDTPQRIANVDPSAGIRLRITQYFRPLTLAHTGNYDKCRDTIASSARCDCGKAEQLAGHNSSCRIYTGDIGTA